MIGAFLIFRIFYYELLSDMYTHHVSVAAKILFFPRVFLEQIPTPLTVTCTVHNNYSIAKQSSVQRQQYNNNNNNNNNN